MVLQMDINNAMSNDAPKDENWKLSPTKKAVNCNITALITILNSPNVITVMGSDNRNKIGLINALSNAKTKLATSAIQILETKKTYL